MRRIMTWLLSTISALVLLFSYHTSTSAAGASTVIAQGTEGTASNGSAPNDSGPTWFTRELALRFRQPSTL